MTVVCFAEPCSKCHSKEAAGFAESAMGRSMARAEAQPSGSFTHEASGSHFTIREAASGLSQSFERDGEKQTVQIEWTIGSGEHATGYLAQIGDHLFQSPLSYYTARRAWDMAPGYEKDLQPDFTRPVTLECLTCHAGKPLPLENTLNSYQVPPFAQLSIGCERCHGPGEAHSRNPVRGTIVNPADLPVAERDSICEQCHLSGDIRIPNPGRSLADFMPGEKLEDVFTVYVARQPAQHQEIKVVSHVEQLSESVCARQSGGKLWCGSCHDPHQKPAQPVAYYRERCLSCHAGKLAREHAAAGQDCVGCHMPKRPAQDGGHTAFTDHRITRWPRASGEAVADADLRAWREPPVAARDRNRAMALVTVGLQNGRPAQVIEGYRVLNRMPDKLSGDAAALTVLGTVLLTAKQPKEAESRYREAWRLRPGYAPYAVNLANALAAEGDLAGAVRFGEQALQLDPLLAQGVQFLVAAYRKQGESAKAHALEQAYRARMGFREEAR